MNKYKSLQQVKAIAKEAFVFFRSMIDQYYLTLKYGTEGGQLVHNKFLPLFWDSPPGLFGYFTIAFIDNRKEPLVLKTPSIKTDHYFSISCIDAWANNYVYFGTRTTGNGPADYLIRGPRWNGTVPSTIKAVATAEGYYSTVFLRLEVQHPNDESDIQYVQNVILNECKLIPLSEYNGEPPSPPLPEPRFPIYDKELLKKADVFKYVNFLMQYYEIHPSEKEFFDQFAQIGISPGAPWPPVNVDPATYEAIGQGVWEAYDTIHSERERQVENLIGGWEYICGLIPPLVGDRQVMEGRYLARAGEAQSTFEWPNSKEEGVYMQARESQDGKPLMGTNSYLIHWLSDDIPKPTPPAMWSMTVYTKTGRPGMGDHCISSNEEIYKNPDGSIDISLLPHSAPTPPSQPGFNWLKAPTDEEFQVFVRIYWPKERVLDGTYTPPLPFKINEQPKY